MVFALLLTALHVSEDSGSECPCQVYDISQPVTCTRFPGSQTAVLGIFKVSFKRPGSELSFQPGSSTHANSGLP